MSGAEQAMRKMSREERGVMARLPFVLDDDDDDDDDGDHHPLVMAIWAMYHFNLHESSLSITVLFYTVTPSSFCESIHRVRI